MKKIFYTFLFTLITLPSLGYAQFTGFVDETGLSVPSYTTDTSVVGGASNVGGGDAFNFTGTNDFQIEEVNTNVNRSNNRCNVSARTLSGYVDYIGCMIRVAILPFVFTLALLTFIWGVTVMLRHPDNEESQKEGKTFILWGIIGFFVITSVYALVSILTRTLKFPSNFEKDTTPYVQLKEKVQKLK